MQLCKSKNDLYEIMQEHGIGTFQLIHIKEMAYFFESEGDPQIKLERPVKDLRRADSIYRKAKDNLKRLTKELEHFLRQHSEALSRDIPKHHVDKFKAMILD